jgi:hypothetical protein
MNVYWKHFKVIMKHKWYVAKECFKHGLYWQGIVHDLSKFSIAEFSESARYFQGNGSPIVKSRKVNGYSIAWLHHKAHNKHHWDYWVDFAHGQPIPTAIPEKYLKEMACDILGASKSYATLDPLKYFDEHSMNWIVKPEYREYVRDMLVENISKRKE